MLCKILSWDVLLNFILTIILGWAVPELSELHSSLSASIRHLQGCHIIIATAKELLTFKCDQKAEC